jgi:hypothetical protein
MERSMCLAVISIAAIALALMPSAATADLQNNQSNLTNVASASDEDSDAMGAAALTDLKFAYTFWFFDPRGHYESVDIYYANLTVTCIGLTAGAYYDVQCQYRVPYGGYQLVERSRFTADDFGNISATFEILVAKKWNIPVSVSRVSGTPQPDPWQDALTPVLQGWVAPKGS